MGKKLNWNSNLFFSQRRTFSDVYGDFLPVGHPEVTLLSSREMVTTAKELEQESNKI